MVKKPLCIELNKHLPVLITLLTFGSFAVATEIEILKCEFLSDTDLETGRKLTKEYYDRQNYYSKVNDVFVEIDKSKKKLKFFPNDGVYSAHLYSLNKGKQHNGLSDGNYHQISYKEMNSSIEWEFILMPNYNPAIWFHSLNRYTGKLKIRYEDFWVNEYDCKKSKALF